MPSTSRCLSIHWAYQIKWVIHWMLCLKIGTWIMIWLVVSTPLKNNSQLGWLFPIYGKIKHVPNHQPDDGSWILIIFSPFCNGQNLPGLSSAFSDTPTNVAPVSDVFCQRAILATLKKLDTLNLWRKRIMSRMQEKHDIFHSFWGFPEKNLWPLIVWSVWFTTQRCPFAGPIQDPSASFSLRPQPSSVLSRPLLLLLFVGSVERSAEKTTAKSLPILRNQPLGLPSFNLGFWWGSRYTFISAHEGSQKHGYHFHLQIVEQN